MIPRHFFRMAKWARNPPSMRQVRLFFAVLLLCLAVAAVEWLFGPFEMLRPQKLGL